MVNILLCLPARERLIVRSKLEFIRLKVHHVLHEPGDTLKSVYFCNSGLISILSVFPDGDCVEVGLVGKEGFIGNHAALASREYSAAELFEARTQSV